MDMLWTWMICSMSSDTTTTSRSSCEEMLLALGSDLDEGVLKNLHERQVKQKTLVNNTLSLYQSQRRSYQILRAMMKDILEHEQQNMLISQKERSRDRAAPTYSSKRETEKWQRLPLLDVKRLVLKRRKVFLWTWPSKEREGQRTKIRSLNLRDNSAERQYAKKDGGTCFWRRKSSSVCHLQKRKLYSWSKV